MDALDLAGRDAAVLSAVEIGLGSVLHGFKVPLAGHFLSLNQGFILSRTMRESGKVKGARRLPLYISNIAAVLKSLAPAGKKLTPMLAISAQGLLFSFGTLMLGPNMAGAMLGSLLLSLWGFIQPLLIYYVLFGSTMLEVAEYFYERSREVYEFKRGDLLLVVVLLVGFKAALSVLATLAAYRLPDGIVQRYTEKMLRAGKHKRARLLEMPAKLSLAANARLALGDLLNPVFVISLALTAIFFVFVEAGASKVIWALLRPVAVGFILFFAIRLLPVENLLVKMERSSFKRFARSFRGAVQTLKSL